MNEMDKKEQGNELKTVLDYHERTKHHTGRYAESLGYMDWKIQPDPFRIYRDSPLVLLDEIPPDREGRDPSFDDVSEGVVQARNTKPNKEFIAELLYDSFAISAWKAMGSQRWSLRCNPSSGNLHPTEAYLIVGEESGLEHGPGLYHYSPLFHGLEQRYALTPEIFQQIRGKFPKETLFLGLTSIHWRESWKYGERAFRYCQLDAGHALAGLSYSAAALGWSVVMIDSPSDDTLAALLAIEGQEGPEREHPEVLFALFPQQSRPENLAASSFQPDPDLIESIRALDQLGSPNVLSKDHHDWPVIDDVARASRKPETELTIDPVRKGETDPSVKLSEISSRSGSARKIFRERRSAVDMDGETWLDPADFFRMIQALLPDPGRPPFSAISWSPSVHLFLFVHRVRGLEPGLYCLLRTDRDIEAERDALKDKTDTEFLWSRVDEAPSDLPLFLLERGDFRRPAGAISCGQAIASEGVFAVSMVVDFEKQLEEVGPHMYRRLFWEAGAIGQVLYIEAQAAGIGATGIGCFFDDEMHQLLGFEGKIHQTFYHLTVGGPVSDERIQTLPAYFHRDQMLEALSKP